MNLELECPSCHRVNRARARSCDECGVNLLSGKAGRRSSTTAAEQPGVLGLAVGTIIHPIRTMDAFFYYVSDMSMVGKMAIFYLASLPISGFITSYGNESVSWVQGMLAEAAGFGVSTLCILAAGRVLGQPGSLLGCAAILGFTRAVVTFVAVLYSIAIVIGLGHPTFIVVLAFMIWSLVLNIMALTNIFGCSAGVAFLISLIAGFLRAFVMRGLGITG